ARALGGGMLGAMRDRRDILVLAALVAALSLMASASWQHATPSGRVSRRHFDLIKVGMTRAEVEAILDYPKPLSGGCMGGRAPDTPVEVVRAQGTHCPDWEERQWSWEDRFITVWFRPEGTVADKEFVRLGVRPPSTFKRILNSIGW